MNTRYIILFAAFALSTVTALFSVSGILKIFGFTIPLILMGILFELAKIVSITMLHNSWKALGWIRLVLIPTSLILVGITTMGVFSYLTTAYESTIGAKMVMVDQETANIEAQKLIHIQRIDNAKSSVSRISSQVETLRATQVAMDRSIASQERPGSTISSRTYKDISARDNRLQSLLHAQDSMLQIIPQEMLAIAKLDSIAGASKTTSTIEVGTLRFIGDVLGVDPGGAVKWFIFLLCVCLDPVALALLISFSRVSSKTQPKHLVEASPNTQVPLIKDSEIAHALDSANHILENPPKTREIKSGVTHERFPGKYSHTRKTHNKH